METYEKNSHHPLHSEKQENAAAQLAEEKKLQILLKYIRQYSNAVAVLNLETGELNYYASRFEDFFKHVHSWEEANRMFLDRVLPQAREEFLQCTSMSNIREKLKISDQYRFSVFVKGDDGQVRRLLNSFYRIDDENVYAFVVNTDTTGSYLHEQKIQELRRNGEAVRISDAEHPDRPQQERRKRTILAVEDSEINREILQEILREEYEVILAADGLEGIRLLKEHRERLSAVILDVYMPKCDGFEFLKRTRKDPSLAAVPVIVATGSDRQEDEEECLRLGASDYITKPYNQDLMLGRIRNIIQLNESLTTLSVVEYDGLTGLYNMSAFYHHGSRFLHDHDGSFDLMMLDISDFSGINSIYGEKCGDEVLQFIAERLRSLDKSGIIARQADSFYLLKTQEPLKEACVLQFCEGLSSGGPVSNLRFRVGVYQNIDASQPIYALCSRVRLAADAAAVEGAVGISYYDEALEEKRSREQWMLMVFEQALEERQFSVWLQPKVETTTGRIVSAEALVRWADGAGGFISPAEFIPLLEREGLIWQLDEYVFRTVCDYQKALLSGGKRCIPVSVNLSRNSLFRGGLPGYYRSIASEKGVPLSMVPLEITESAAASETQISSICDAFVKKGFTLHMDDFGAGYSSLSSLATLPFTMVKLDKQLIDRIGTEKGDILIKSCVEAAQDLGMAAVAEGVETEEQLKFLSLISCDLIQGYYFSPPVPMEAFEALLAEDSLGRHMPQNPGEPEDVIRISSAEKKRYLKICRMLFSTVRVIDVECWESQMADKKGILGRREHECFTIWGQDRPCEDCISLKTLQTHKRGQKVHQAGDRFYIAYSAYLEIDGKPHVIELINEIEGSEKSEQTE